MEAASPDFVTGFFNGLGNAIAEAFKGLAVLVMSSMAAAPGVASVIQLHWAERWQRLRTSLLLSVIVGAVLTMVSVYALIIAFAMPDGSLYNINEIYEVFPFGAALLLLWSLWVQLDNRVTFDRCRAAGIVGGIGTMVIVLLVG
jgi:hypothetical protein